MKKKLIMLCFGLIVLHSVKGQGIRFEENLTWEQVKAKAKAENKNIFIDFYTTWCIPCKAMDENVYPIKEVGDYFNNRYISIKVQMDSTGKDGDPVKLWRQTAKMMEKRYAIPAYPTMYFVNSSGDPLMKVSGLQTAEGLMKMAEIALDTNSSYMGLYRQYLSGIRGGEFMLKLIGTGKALGQVEQVEQIGREYVQKLSGKDLFDRDNLLIMETVTKTTKDKGFQVFYKQPQKVVQSVPDKFTLAYINTLVGSIIDNNLIKPYFTSLNGSPDWATIMAKVRPYGKIGQDVLLRAQHRDATIKMLAKFKASGKSVLQPIFDSNKTFAGVLDKIKALNTGLGEEYLIGSTVVYYMNNMYGNFDNFYQSANYYDLHFNVMLDPGALNNWAWISFENTTNKVYLEKALAWSKRSLDLSPGNPMYTDSYANLLYKLGRKEEAIQWEQKALAADPNNVDFNLALERMKKDEPTWPAR